MNVSFGTWQIYLKKPTNQAGLELSLLLPQTPECWDYECAPPSQTTGVCVCLFIYLICGASDQI
jgi:hypothetical protein